MTWSVDVSKRRKTNLQKPLLNRRLYDESLLTHTCEILEIQDGSDGNVSFRSKFTTTKMVEV